MNIRAALPSQLLHLCILAAFLRLTYILLALQHFGQDGLVASVPDTRTYLAMADYILTGENAFGKEFMFWIGPGYAMMIGTIQSLLSTNHIFLYVCNILFGVLAPVPIYLLAYELTESRRVAFIAGLIAAVSPTSIALSCNILSDQPFYVVHTFALLCLTLGVKTNRIKWFIIAGFLTGTAAYIRAVSQFWPLAYVLLAAVLTARDRMFWGHPFSRRALFKRLILTFGIASVLLLGWATRNLIVEGAFVFGGNGLVAARWHVASRAVAENTDDASVHDVRLRWLQEDQEFYGDSTPTTIVKYHRFRDEFFRVFRTHPDWTIEAFFANVKDNMISGNYIARDQVPVLYPMWVALISADQTWLSYLIVTISLLGIVILLTEKRYYSAFLLGMTLLYFTLVIGFSRWQGSRLHYPAEIAWSILVSYVFVRASGYASHLVYILRMRVVAAVRSFQSR